MTSFDRANIIATLIPLMPFAERLRAEAERRRESALNVRILVNREAERALEAALASDNRFSRRQMGFRSGGSWTVFDAASAAGWLLHHAAALGPDQAVADLDWALKASRADVELVGLLGGVQVEQEVHLGPGVRLIPFASLSSGPMKDDLEMERAPWRGGINVAGMPPQTCIVLACPDMPFYAHVTDRDEGSLAAEERIHTIASLLASIPNCTPTLRPVWWQPLDRRLQSFARSGYSWRFEPQNQFPARPVSVDAAAADLVAAYEKLEDDDQRAIIVAARRLRTAKCGIEPGDTAVDAAICLEGLLTSSNEGNYRQAFLRRAKLMAPDDIDGWASKKVADELYALRGKVVHGHVPGSKVPPEEVSKRGVTLAENAIRRVLELGHIPRWRPINEELAPPSFTSEGHKAGAPSDSMEKP